MEVALRRENGETLCERCVLADTALARMKGLLGRSELPSDQGVLLRPASSVHTGFMRFPIDVVFLDDEDRIVKISDNVPPWRTAGARHAAGVLEIRAGEAAQRQLRVGDKVTGARRPTAVSKPDPVTRRGRPLLSNAILAALYLGFAGTNIMNWRTTHHPVGLGLVLFELVAATLFMVRRDPLTTSREPLAWVATAIGTWGILAARPAYAPLFGLGWLFFTLQLLGAATAICSLGALGRCFGLVAANRGIRTSGPYRLVRHPVYASYFVADIAYTFENPSNWNVSVLAAVLTCQLVRIRTEEACLRADPGYRTYCERVRYRLLPLVW
ncbi:MAG: DUF192 domain-containing protein [Gaiellaceae bacterium]